MLIKKLTTDEIHVLVHQYGSHAFHVIIQDVDSDETLGTVRIYPTLEGALAFAQKCARS